MAEPFIGEIRMFSFGIVPKGWALCNGGLLPIAQNQALFSLLATTYGGDGRVNFALPDLQGRAPIHFTGPYPLGQKAGEEIVTLTDATMPVHNHLLLYAAGAGTTHLPTTALAESSNPDQYYYAAPTAGNVVQLNPDAVGQAGGSQPHNNVQPFLTINYCIALQGIFPSRS